jgi:hypothetical protein
VSLLFAICYIFSQIKIYFNRKFISIFVRFKHKCEQYWPDSGTETYGDIEVTLVKIEEFADYVTHTLQLNKVENTKNLFTSTITGKNKENALFCSLPKRLITNQLGLLPESRQSPFWHFP